MIYNIEDIRLLKVAEGKKNAGQLYLKFTAMDPENPIDNGEVTVLDPLFVKMYEPYLQLAQQDGVDQFNAPKYKPSLLKDATKPLPESLLKAKYTQFEKYVFPNAEVMVQLDAEGNPRKNEKGNFVTAQSIWVFTWKRVDNQTGELGYVRNWDPESRGKSIMENFYKPLKDFTTTASTGIVLPQGEDAPLINGESAPAV